MAALLGGKGWGVVIGGVEGGKKGGVDGVEKKIYSKVIMNKC